MAYGSLLDEGPKLMVTFCFACTTEASVDAANTENTAATEGFTMILEGLVDCIACSGNSLQVGYVKEIPFLIYFMS